jgi:hypothetical protein
MGLDSSKILIEYLQESFPGARVYESTREADEWPLKRCFRVKDGRPAQLVVASSILFATRSEVELREWLDDIELADYMVRAQGAPVLLSEDGPRLVE